MLHAYSVHLSLMSGSARLQPRSWNGSGSVGPARIANTSSPLLEIQCKHLARTGRTTPRPSMTQPVYFCGETTLTLNPPPSLATR